MTTKLKATAGRGRTLTAGLLAGTMLAGAPIVAHAAEPTDNATVAEVIVTAQKREENLQKVSASVIALDSKTLTQRNVADFQDYAKFLPSVSFQSTAPGATNITMRGVASGENSNHSGPLPTVGLYLDEQSVTTIGGALDVHVYDVARIESLAGPQGTLWGASAESGVVRIITNKPTSAGFQAGYDVSGNTMDKGGQGYTAEGFINVPVNEKVAVRLVGWATHDGGYIDNVYGTRTFKTSGATANNAGQVQKDFNPVDTVGGRAALKVDLNDIWTVNAQVLGQDQWQKGVFGYEPSVGDLKVNRFQPDRAHDRFYQAALTVTGKVAKYDITYTSGYFQRAIDTLSDYTDYSYWYDQINGLGAFWTDSAGNFLEKPLQAIAGQDRFDKSSNEIRIASPKTDRLRFVAGLFEQHQTHWIIQDYTIQNFDPALSPTGYPGTIWLTNQMRIDRDQAAFGEASFDVTDRLTLTGGVRAYHYKNTLKGFFGYGKDFSSSTGESACFIQTSYRGGPCINLNKAVEDSGNTYKADVTYKLTDTKLVYATYATGYRPGGVNRKGDLPPYVAEDLVSYEIGWKTSWFDKKVRFNGAVYEENWKNFQFSFLGANGLTQIANAGQARTIDQPPTDALVSVLWLACWLRLNQSILRSG
jgi:iron complex outermembrane receptor protein